MSGIPGSVRARMLLRSFAVQGSWNYETLIGAGFCFTILPALRHLYGDDQQRLSAATARHAELFNSHPYMATIAAGAVSRLESDGTDEVMAQRFKTALRGSLGSLGDQLFWTTWRPMAMLLGLVVYLAGGGWQAALISFLVVYNALHIVVRYLGLETGYAAGLGIGHRIRDLPIRKVIDRASQLASFLIGLAVVLVSAPGLADPVGSVLTLVGIAAGFWLGLRTRRIMIVLLIALSVIGFTISFAGYGA